MGQPLDGRSRTFNGRGETISDTGDASIQKSKMLVSESLWSAQVHLVRNDT
jgi:hypothetical protein